MTVAYEARSQEDEHSCFSDNTTADIVGNARGIQMVFTGNYGVVSGAGVRDLVAISAPGLRGPTDHGNRPAAWLSPQLFPAPSTCTCGRPSPMTSPAGAAVLRTIVALEDQTDTIVAAAEAVGVTITVS